MPRAALSTKAAAPLGSATLANATPTDATQATPAFFEFAAPTQWRAIDFISDLHLCESMPRTFAAWAAHLHQTTADAVFILGDLFDVWVGDDSRSQPFERACLEVLSQAASHRHLAFMVGNRDFLFGSAALRQTGMLGLPDPTMLDAWGQRVVLSHGDALCLADTPYQAFRREVRGAAWQADFLARPLAARVQLAARMRAASGSRQGVDGNASVDIDSSEAVMWMHALGAHELVHGHTHRPGSNALAPGFVRHVLSDWDLDGQLPRAEVLRLTRDGFQRLAPSG
jgi:UDP-2,3-diacylglucosamine hydrolase